MYCYGVVQFVQFKKKTITSKWLIVYSGYSIIDHNNDAIAIESSKFEQPITKQNKHSHL